jgi:hypothetical protein
MKILLTAQQTLSNIPERRQLHTQVWVKKMKSFAVVDHSLTSDGVIEEYYVEV